MRFLKYNRLYSGAFQVLIILLAIAFCNHLHASNRDSTTINKSFYAGLFTSTQPQIKERYTDGQYTYFNKGRNFPYQSIGILAGYAFKLDKWEYSAGLEFLSGKETYLAYSDNAYLILDYWYCIPSIKTSTDYHLISTEKRAFTLGCGLSFNHKRYYGGQSDRYDYRSGQWHREKWRYDLIDNFTFSPLHQTVFLSPDLYIGFEQEFSKGIVGIKYRLKFNGARSISQNAASNYRFYLHQFILAYSFSN